MGCGLQPNGAATEDGIDGVEGGVDTSDSGRLPHCRTLDFILCIPSSRSTGVVRQEGVIEKYGQ